MSHFGVIKRGSPAPTPPAATRFAAALNMINPNFWTYLAPTVDTASASQFDYSGAVTLFDQTFGVPEANRDADGYPKSLPSGKTYVTVSFQEPATNAQRVITWSSKAGGSNQGLNTPDLQGATGITYDLPNRRITYTPADATPQASQSNIFLRYVPNSTSDYPINFSDKPVVDPGTLLTTDFTSGVQGVTDSGAPIRFMKWTTVERNNWVIDYTTIKNPVDGDGQLGEPIYTALNRNKNPNDLTRRDGVPVEKIIAVATALNRGIWYTMPWNADATFYADVGAQLAAFSLATGLKVHIEMSNEVWNLPLYTVGHQSTNEAALLGITNEQRYAQKAVAAFAYFETAFASAGVTSKLVRVLAWQNYASPAIWDSMMGVAGVSSHVDAFAVAPYYGDNVNMGVPASYTTSVSALAALCQTDQDDSLSRAVGHLAKAQSYGKALHFYEGGLTVSLSDATFKASFARSSNVYDLELRFMQQIEKLFPATTVAEFFAYSYPLNAGDNYQWGLLEYGSQTRSKASTPKWQAHSDFVSGVRALSAATGSLGLVGVPATNGDSLGALTASVLGATWALASDDGGRLTINATTGVVTVANASLFTVAETRSCTIRQLDSGDPAGHFDQVVSYSVGLKYRYYRLRTTATQASGGVAFAEFAGATASGGTNQFLSKTATATSTFDAVLYPGSKAVDGDASTFWNSDFGGTWPQDLVIDLGVGNGKAVAEFKITARSGSQANQAPGDFVFSGSNDNVTYTTLKTLTSQTYTSAETKTFTIP